jgi:TonB family protein
MRYLPMKNTFRHLMRAIAICLTMLTAIQSAVAVAGDDGSPAPQTPLEALLKNLPKDKTEAGKVIFEKIIDALGGRENLLKIRDSKISVDYDVLQGNLDLMTVYYMKLPDKFRVDLNNSWTKVFDGKDAWQFDAQGGGSKKLSKDALAEFKSSALSVQGMLYPENLDLSPVLEGQVLLQGKYYLVISYANRNGYDTINVCVDPTAFLPFMSTSIKPRSRIVVVSTEYREIEGVKVPFSIDIQMDDKKTIRMMVREWKLNSNLDDALFEKKSVKAQIKKGPQMDPAGFIDNVPNPELVHRVKPVYPEIALRAQITAKVILRITVDEGGRPRNLMVYRGHPLLNEAAITAVKEWRYRPTIQNGKPVRVTILVPVEFR